ncbi:MAG: tetratricopeptide repeat protein [Verrucomicrobiota bacterium]
MPKIKKTDCSGCLNGRRAPARRRSREFGARAGCVLLACVLSAGMVAHADVAWHHSRSPFRAEFTVKNDGNHPDAGILLSVPVCGLADEGGGDLLAFDERGHSLFLDSLGPTRDNSALAAVAPPKRGKRLFVYFGSGVPSRLSPGVFRHGLHVEIRSLPDGSMKSVDSAKRLLRHSTLRGVVPVRSISLSANPLSNLRNLILRFRGHLRVPERESLTLFLSQNGAGYVWIDDRLVIERNGNHSAQDNRQGQDRTTVELRPELAPLECLVVNRERPLTAVLAEYKDKKNKRLIPPDRFVQAGEATLDAVAARRSDQACPAFTYKHVSYIGYEQDQFTEVRLKTLNGQSAQWRFEDGCELEGETVTRILPGLNSISLATAQGRARAEGTVSFPQNPPARRRIDNSKHFDAYADVMMQCDPAKLNTPTLAAYWRFLRYRERNPHLETVCDALITRDAVRPEERKQIALDFARNASDRPRAVRNAYQMVLGESDGADERIRHAREFAEFAIVELDDDELAETLIRRIASASSDDDSAVLGILRLQRALHNLNMEEARAALDRFREFVVKKSDSRTVNVRANALAERYDKALDTGYFQRAREALWDWETLSPSDWENGRLALARARLWRALGWLRAAKRELRAARELDPLLPLLPEVEYKLAEVLEQRGETQQARALWQAIAENYPNHVVAEQARRQLQNP